MLVTCPRKILWHGVAEPSNYNSVVEHPPYVVNSYSSAKKIPCYGTKFDTVTKTHLLNLVCIFTTNLSEIHFNMITSYLCLRIP